MLNKIKDLKAITFLAKAKSYIKELKWGSILFGFFIGTGITFLIFIMCGFINLTEGSYKKCISMELFSIIPLSIFFLYFWYFLYKTYNSPTFSSKNKKYDYNCIKYANKKEKPKKYYIIQNLKSGALLVQDKRQINKSKSFPVQYKIFNNNKIIPKTTYLCSMQLSKDTKWHCAHISFDMFLIIFFLIIAITIFIIFFNNSISINFFNILLKSMNH